MFIDTDDTIYLTRVRYGDILRWVHGTTTNISNPDQIVSGPIATYSTPFVSLEKDVHFEVASPSGRIEKRSVNGSTNVFVAQFNGPCTGFFIDVNNTLYCSIGSQNLVRSVSLNRNGSTVIIRAGIGSGGLGANELNHPWGIFVDLNFDLYVADGLNHRIQRFMANEFNGTTVAGKGIPKGLHIAMPTDVILDGNNHLYIADNNNHRVVRVSSSDFQCLIGCSGVSGSAADQLWKSFSVRLDTYGSLHISDEYNGRVQKLTLTSNCEGRSLLMLSLCAIDR